MDYAVKLVNVATIIVAVVMLIRFIKSDSNRDLLSRDAAIIWFGGLVFFIFVLQMLHYSNFDFGPRGLAAIFIQSFAMVVISLGFGLLFSLVTLKTPKPKRAHWLRFTFTIGTIVLLLMSTGMSMSAKP